MIRYLLFLALPALAFAQKVTVEFDQSMEFSSLKTFKLLDGTFNSKDSTLNNDIVRKNLQNDIRRKLTAKGLTESADKPDVIVSYSLGSANRKQTDRYPTRWGGARRVTTHYAEGTLVIDMRDPLRQELVWRAVAVADSHDPARIQARLGDMVRKSFDKFPPKKKSS